MPLPKGFKKNIKLVNDLTGVDRREEIVSKIVDGGTFLPKGVHYKDIDSTFIDFVNDQIKIVVDGELVPAIFLTIQRYSEFTKTWQVSDEYKNIKMPFITIVRQPNVQPGTIYNEYKNIPGRIAWSYYKVPTNDGVRVGVDLYKVPQPTAVDISYDVRFFSNKMSDLNLCNEKIQQLFKSIQCYVYPNEHPMSITLSDVGDESIVDDLENRRFYVQNFSMLLRGYILDENDFEVVPTINRAIVLSEIDIDNNNGDNAIDSVNFRGPVIASPGVVIIKNTDNAILDIATCGNPYIVGNSYIYNSGVTFSAYVAATNPYLLPNVTHYDCDGSAIEYPGMMSFTANSVCNDVNIYNSGSTYVESIPSGTAFELPNSFHRVFGATGDLYIEVPSVFNLDFNIHSSTNILLGAVDASLVPSGVIDILIPDYSVIVNNNSIFTRAANEDAILFVTNTGGTQIGSYLSGSTWSIGNSTVFLNSINVGSVLPTNNFSLNVINTGGTQVGQFSGGSFVIGNSNILINSTSIPSVVAEGTKNISVINTGGTQIGSYLSGSTWVVGNSNILLNGTNVGSVSPVNNFSLNVINTGGTQVGQFSGGSFVIGNSAILINSTSIPSVVAEGTKNISVINTGGTQIGSYLSGSTWSISNSTVFLNSINVGSVLPTNNFSLNVVNTGGTQVGQFSGGSFVIGNSNILVNGGSVGSVSPVNNFSLNVINTGGTQVGQFSGGSFVIGNSAILINSTSIPSVVAEGTKNISVVNTGGTQIGSYLSGSTWSISNSTLNINGGNVATILPQSASTIFVTFNGSQAGSWSASTSTWVVTGATSQSVLLTSSSGTPAYAATITLTATPTGITPVSYTFRYQSASTGAITSVTQAGNTLAISAIGYGAVTYDVTATDGVTTVGSTVSVTIAQMAEVTTFLAITGIVDATQISALRTLALRLADIGVWSKLRALYPFIGGTATTHKYNLLNAVDTDAGFRLVFNGGWTHSSTGALSNGTTGNADTKFAENNLAQNSRSFGFYNGTAGSSGYDMSATATPRTTLAANQGGSTIFDVNNGAGATPTTPPASVLGMWAANRQGATYAEVWFNGGGWRKTAATSVASGTTNFFLAQFSGGGANSARSFRLVYISDGLTEQNLVEMYTIVQAYQTTLSRNV